MLDIGVGGGRTTKYFSSLVHEYVGIDYSEKLTNVCKNKFPKLNFYTKDVRDLSTFSTSEFDFILFSYNGIDYISHEDRITAFKQIKRVLKPNGYFYFSSHNIQAIEKWERIPFSLNPLKFAKHLITHYKRKLINQLTTKKIKALQNEDYITINDGAHYGQLETYYVNTEFQIKILEQAGYKNIRVFDLENGKELIGKEIKYNQDTWLYYLCN